MQALFILPVFVLGNCLRKDLFRFYWSLLSIACSKNNVTTQAEKVNMDEGAFNDNEGGKSKAGGADLLFGKGAEVIYVSFNKNISAAPKSIIPCKTAKYGKSEGRK